MSDVRTGVKLIPTIVIMITLVLTTVSLTYGISASATLGRIKDAEIKIQTLEISDAQKESKLNALQDSVNRIETNTEKIQDLLQRHILSPGGK